MAFQLSDFKKTSRRSGDERLLYPYQIRDDRYTAAIGYAVAYYERMLGRRRAEFEAETLLEFFGDPRLARGLVACLARIYIWRAQTLAEALGDTPAQTLRSAGISRPADLRARLYGLANGRYGGVILPDQRAEALDFLCQQIGNGAATPITPAQFEQALTLDSEDQHMLIQQQPTPDPRDIIALYNYHSLETALCHSELLKIRLHGDVWMILRSVHNLTRRYNIRYEISAAPKTLFDEQIEITLHGGRDALGSWTRAGRRLVRVLLRLLAAHPSSLAEASARVHLREQISLLRLDAQALGALGIAAHSEVETPEPWQEDRLATFQRAWSSAFLRGRTAGWRLRRDPEPLLGSGAIIVPDFALVRGRERLLLCLATGASTATALTRDIARLGGRAPVLLIAPAFVAERMRSCPTPLATYEGQPSEAIPALAEILNRSHPREKAAPSLTPWQQLEQMVAEEGFIGEEAVAKLLGGTPEEAAQSVRRWGGPALHVLPGLGVCSPAMLSEIRSILEQGEYMQHAA